MLDRASLLKSPFLSFLLPTRALTDWKCKCRFLSHRLCACVCVCTQAIFGYLTIMIIVKWSTDWTGLVAPSLLDMLINMFLSPGHVQDPIYPAQVRSNNVLGE
jgi:hypothetical protein